VVDFGGEQGGEDVVRGEAAVVGDAGGSRGGAGRVGAAGGVEQAVRFGGRRVLGLFVVVFVGVVVVVVVGLGGIAGGALAASVAADSFFRPFALFFA